VLLDYTNYRGERAIRRVIPQAFGWFKTEFHPEDQWMMRAYDLDKKVDRIYAMKDIHSWKPEQ